MKFVHEQMAAGKWFTLTLAEQLGNVGSEVERAFNRWEKGDYEYAVQAADRALELLDITSMDERWHGAKLKELRRVREVLADRFYGNREYGGSDELLKNYFLYFALAARKGR